MVAAALLIVVVIAGFGVFYSYYASQLSSSGQGVANGIADAAKKTGELMSLVDYQVQGSSVTLYLYDYGTEPITPQQVLLVSGNQQQNPTSQFQLVDAGSGSPITTIKPQELAQLSARYSSTPSSFYIEIIDSFEKTFEYQLSSS